jgi:hypothetical protein
MYKLLPIAYHLDVEGAVDSWGEDGDLQARMARRGPSGQGRI